MTSWWGDLERGLKDHLPSVSVNVLEKQGQHKDESAFAIEVRPRFRDLDCFSAAPLALWSAYVTRTHPCTFCVVFLKLDRFVHEKEEFSSASDIVEFFKSHPLLISSWSICPGIQGGNSIDVFRQKLGMLFNREICDKMLSQSGSLYLFQMASWAGFWGNIGSDIWAKKPVESPPRPRTTSRRATSIANLPTGRRWSGVSLVNLSSVTLWKTTGPTACARLVRPPTGQ